MELQLHAKMFSEARGQIHLLPEEARDTLVGLVDRAEESMRAIRELECVCEDELASARLMVQYELFDRESDGRESGATMT